MDTQEGRPRNISVLFSNKKNVPDALRYARVLNLSDLSARTSKNKCAHFRPHVHFQLAARACERELI